MSKFKVGQRVKVIGNSKNPCGDHCYSVGDVVEIKELGLISTDGVQSYRCILYGDDYDRNQSVVEDDLEEIKEWLVLELKEDVKITGSDYRNKFYPTGIEGDGYEMYLGKSTVVSHLYTLVTLDDPSNLFTQQEVDKMQHGFVRMFDVKKFVMKEPLFYIQIPYLSGHEDAYVNRKRDTGATFLDNERDPVGYKTKFTMDEIKEYYPEFERFAKMV